MARKGFVEKMNELVSKRLVREHRQQQRKLREAAQADAILDEDDDEELDEEDMGTPVDEDDSDWQAALFQAMKVCPPDIAKKIHALLKPQDSEDDSDDSDSSFTDKMESIHRKLARRDYGIQLIQEAKKRTGLDLRVPSKEVGKSGRRPFVA